MAFSSRSPQLSRHLIRFPDVAFAPNALFALRNIRLWRAGMPTYVLRRSTSMSRKPRVVSIMGSSGAGKLTLLHIIGMHERLDRRGHFLDQPVHKLGAAGRSSKQYIGFVFQELPPARSPGRSTRTSTSRSPIATSRNPNARAWCATSSTSSRSSERRIS